MRKFLSKLLFGIVIILSLNACNFDFSDYFHDFNVYYDNDPDLHSIALESIIGTYSYNMNEVLRIEEDAYGRVLFAFYGGNMFRTLNGQEDVLAIVIAQKTDSDFAYYYDSINASAIYVDWLNERLTLNLLESYFDEEEIEELKAKNDWNKPINDKLLFRTEVTRKKTCNANDRDLLPYRDLLGGNLYHGIQCYGKDRNGYMLVSVESELSNQSTRTFAIYLLIVNQNHELISPDAVMRVTDILDMDEIKRFKQENGWSFEKQYD